MRSPIPGAILKFFGPDHYSPDQIKTESISEGLINKTFKVSYNTDDMVLLQQINKNIFQSPGSVQENYLAIWNYLESNAAGIKIPEPKIAEGKSFAIDENHNYWRAFEFINNTRVYSHATTIKHAAETAACFAAFTLALEGLDPSLLKIVIPGFHDLTLRYKQFEESLKNGSAERKNIAGEITDELIKRNHYQSFYEEIVKSDKYPLRIMHHDAKIQNILFDKSSGRVICPVDLDTTMPGYFFSDPGDMIRSMAASADENCTDPSRIEIRKDFYEAIISGYLQVMGNHLTEDEKKNIHYAGLLIIYMQSIRFITDYLLSDPYYKINYPQQNFDRARNQLKLLQHLEELLKTDYGFMIE
jgi:thiamine kinase-like enzyme